MKAMRYHEYGDQDVLRYEEVTRPEPAPGEVLVQVAATSFNSVDVAIRAGYLQDVFPVQFPHTPGLDVAGTVAALGTGVDTLHVGDAVVGFLPMTEDGAAAEFVVVPANVLAKAPRSIPLADAAALPTVGLTAWQALFEHADLRPGQRVLIVGAGGGVGGIAVQLAKQAGAQVIATASSRSAATVRAQGADQVIDYTSTPVAAAVDEPVDAVLSLITGSPTELADLVALIRPGGVIVTTATAAQEDADRQVRAIPMFVRSDTAQLTHLLAQVDADQLRLNVTGRYPLTDLAEVHQRGAAGQYSGKVVITPVTA